MATAAAPAPAPSPTEPEVEPEEQPRAFHSVGDAMTRGALICATVDTTVDEALEFLVDNRITGMPVVDDAGKLIGVVSDYDLLALDSISGPPQQETGLFPSTKSTWKAFKEIQKLLNKTHGKTVGDVMTPNPLAVRPMTNLEDAARLLLESKFRRLPVVDQAGKLVGLLTRGNVVRAALLSRKAASSRQGDAALKGD
ncbi:Cystathionine beta-synthase (CBS) family protein [Klebsormidium nitens]|uniref:Cystathionine beta-synthase (CBS) family protein n=1 Tax=Klebsormidium nitens TaxID=105231 RepID=A0A1Y1IXT3_KLENI|nr:Cystathionine beta-synthase (CBS) family protein [Klebsormidium nitens]|eukprot:GAQ93577.1 Cystathionine beta-synthase (CBS) family protein [Klebsormidium nitens]